MPNYVAENFFTSGAGWASTGPISLPFNGDADVGIFVLVQTDSIATGDTVVNSVVLDPTGLNIPLTQDASFDTRARLGTGFGSVGTPRTYGYSVKGITVSAGAKNVVVTCNNGSAKLRAWAALFTDCVSATFSDAFGTVVANSPYSHSVVSAAGRVVLGMLQIVSLPDAASFAPSGGGTQRRRVLVADVNTAPGAVVTYPGSSNVPVGATVTGGVSNFTWQNFAWDITGSAPPDTTPPTLTGSVTASSITTTSATISWPAGADDTAVTSYETSLDGTTWTDRGNVLTFGLTGLTASTAYTPRVRAKDAAGNVSTPAITGSFTTAAPPDTTEPTQTGAITIGTVSSTSIQMSWPAGSDNVGVVGYDVSSNGGSNWTQLGNVLTHTFTGLTPSTTYQLRVRPRDAAGNVDSTPLAASQATAAPATYAMTLGPFALNTGSGPLLSTAVSYTLWPGVDTGAVTGTPINGTGTTHATTGALAITGLAAAGSYLVVVKNANGSGRWHNLATAA